MKAGEQSFAILTAWRAANPPSTNKGNQAALKAQVRSAGKGFFDMNGHWREEQADRSFVDTAEPSIFVPGLELSAAQSLAQRYEQDAIIYAGPETGGEVALVWKNGSIQKIGKFHPNKIAQAYSQVKGRSFTFEGFELLPNCMVEAQLAMTIGQQVL
jgi:hypothetical protein